MLYFHQVLLIACFNYFYLQISYFTFSNTLIDRETINLTPTPCGFDPYLPMYYAKPCTYGITIDGHKDLIKFLIKEKKKCGTQGEKVNGPRL